MVPLAVSRWININLAVSMEPAERRTLVKTAELLLKHIKNVPNSTELKCRLSWIIVQSRIDAKDYESASKLLDKVRFCRHALVQFWKTPRFSSPSSHFHLPFQIYFLQSSGGVFENSANVRH